MNRIVLRPVLALCVALLVAPFLAACGSSALLDNRSPAALVLDRDSGGAVTFSYAVGQPASVSIYLEDSAGTRYMLRDNQLRTPSDQPYSLRFDGTAPTSDPVYVQRSLPSGNYRYVIAAKPSAGAAATSGGTLTIRGRAITPLDVTNLTVSPATVSPNADGIDDQAEITYQLPVTATVDLTITRPDGGNPIPLVAGEQQDPTPQRALWNGKTSDGAILPNGAYSYTLQARDDYGNVVRKTGTIAIVNSGQPEATITYTNIAPARIQLGDVITITLRVKNTGDIPIRTYGPASGYEYSTNDVFSSIQQGQYVQKSGGFWRAGVDWDGNTSAGPRRYPYRWAITPRPPEKWKVPFQEDLLMPGEEATVIGRIRVDQQETKMGFYAGLTWDGVGFRQDRIGRQIIEVGF